MPELHISDEVRALLGPEGLARAAEVSLDGGECVACRTRLDGGIVNMVVRTGGTFTVASYVHAACGPSEVIEMGPEFAPAEPADGYSMTMTAAVIDHGGADLPVLVAEGVSKVYVINDGPGELTNAVVSHLLGQGFALMTRMRQAPPRIHEWVGVLLFGHGPAGEDGLLVLDDDGGQFFHRQHRHPRGVAGPGRPLRLGRAVRRRRRPRRTAPGQQGRHQGPAHRRPGRTTGRRPHRGRKPAARLTFGRSGRPLRVRAKAESPKFG